MEDDIFIRLTAAGLLSVGTPPITGLRIVAQDSVVSKLQVIKILLCV
jgi:hypothetical protein